MEIYRAEDRPTLRGRTEWFTGNVFVEEIATCALPSRLSIARVTFEPTARTAWHMHPISQVLHVLSGVGRIQKEGQPIQILHPGDTVTISAGENHWHGAGPAHVFVHLAVQEMENGTAAAWGEFVTDEQYQAI